MDQRPAPDFTISRKNSTSTGAAKRPKLTKTSSTPVNATGRGGGKRGGSIGAASKSTRGGGRGGTTRGTTRGRRGSAGVGGGRKLSIQRQQLTSSQRTQQDNFDGAISSVTTPAPSTTPSTPRDAYFSVPPTPGSELDQYTFENDLAEAEELKMLLDNFSEEQLKRYEVYRRSALSKPNMVGQILGHPCSHNMSIVVAGFAKVFVGEIIEKALDVRQEWGETGSLSPEHLREAYRRYKKDTKLTTHNYQKRLFNK
ncbi:14742_t:CDS:2 [Funneliformis caledonium]|uniref:Transcription initiation factor TFIID subunit 11 n=1 Tax=Funneliformis caledonium TaxID=1117310 RepID=A0A9N8VVB4_9GLOM|nr:14742_t:CDS:2 [Funneliformis caledonium]